MEILVKQGVRTEIAKRLKVSSMAVTYALRYQLQSQLGKLIRHIAITEYNGQKID